MIHRFASHGDCLRRYTLSRRNRVCPNLTSRGNEPGWQRSSILKSRSDMAQMDDDPADRLLVELMSPSICISSGEDLSVTSQQLMSAHDVRVGKTAEYCSHKRRPRVATGRTCAGMSAPQCSANRFPSCGQCENAPGPVSEWHPGPASACCDAGGQLVSLILFCASEAEFARWSQELV